MFSRLNFALLTACALWMILVLVGEPSGLAQANPLSLVNAPVLKWAIRRLLYQWCQTGWYASPAVADLDGDAQAEVIWGSYDVVALDGQ